MKRDWTQEEIKLLKEKYSTEISREDLCKLFDRRWGSLEVRARQLGLKRPGLFANNKNKWTQEEIKLLKQIFSEGNLEEIYASFPKRSSTAVIVKAKKLKLKRIVHAQRQTNFKVLLEDNPISFYWIGFLLGDGCIDFKVKALSLRLSIKDTDHCKKFATFVESKVTFWEGWYFSPLLGGWRYARNAIVRGADKINVPLIAKKFDWKKRKTYNPPNTNKWKFSDDNIIALIIGFIDADGCITKQTRQNRKGVQVRIRCHQAWLGFMKYLDEKVHRILNVKKERDYWSLIPATKDRCSVAKVAWWKHVINSGLKRKAIKLNLPIMNRKWDKVDHTLGDE